MTPSSPTVTSHVSARAATGHAPGPVAVGIHLSARKRHRGPFSVLPGRALPADATQSVASPSTGGESQRQQGEPGGSAHGPATPSHATNEAAGVAPPTAS